MNQIEGNQASITYGGKHINTYGKLIVMEVITYYIENKCGESIDKSTDYYKRLKLAVESIYASPDKKNIDDMWSNFLKNITGESANDALLTAYVVFKPIINASSDNLLMRTIYAYGKVKRLESKTSWFDNFRLVGLSNGANHVVWNDYGKSDIYAIGKSPSPIDDTYEVSSYTDAVKFLVGELRRFIIENKLYPTNKTYEFVKPKSSYTMSLKEVCDECYKIYPFYFGGAYGCDFFKYSAMAPTIELIDSFLKRYTSAIIGFIVNTTSYESGESGKHWTCLMFKKNNCYFVNSAGNPIISSLDIGPEFERRLQELGYGNHWNNITLQTDTYSCGMFSFVSMYLMLCYDCNIEQTVNRIGVDGKNLIKNFKDQYGHDITINSFTEVLAAPSSTKIELKHE